MLALFLKARRPGLGSMMGDLFDMPVQVRSYTRADGTSVPPHTEVRQVRRDPEAEVHAEAKQRHDADHTGRMSYGEHVEVARAARKEVEKPDAKPHPDKPAPAPDLPGVAPPPKPAEAKPTIPEGVMRNMDIMLNPLVDGARGLAEARKVQAGGGGRYAAEWAQPREQAWEAAKARITQALASIKDPANRAAAQAYIDSKMPDLTLTPAERAWFSREQGAAKPKPRASARFKSAYKDQSDYEVTNQENGLSTRVRILDDGTASAPSAKDIGLTDEHVISLARAKHAETQSAINPTVTKTLDRIKRALADEATDPDSLRADLKKLDNLDQTHWQDVPTREAILALRRQVAAAMEPAQARKMERMRAEEAKAKAEYRASQPAPGSYEAQIGALADKPHIFPAEGAAAKSAVDPAVAKVLDRVKSALSSGATDYDSLIDALRPLDNPEHVDLQAMSGATRDAILSLRGKLVDANGPAAPAPAKPKKWASMSQAERKETMADVQRMVGDKRDLTPEEKDRLWAMEGKTTRTPVAR